MNLFKGPLYLLDLSPAPSFAQAAPRYGAASAQHAFANLGNRAAAERWLGRPHAAASPAGPRPAPTGRSARAATARIGRPVAHPRARRTGVTPDACARC